jgi:hypothetical protein
MTGAEIAAIIGIISGFATCGQYATQVYDKIKNKREHARVLQQAEQLGISLQDGHSAMQDGLNNLRGLGHVLLSSQGM